MALSTDIVSFRMSIWVKKKWVLSVTNKPSLKPLRKIRQLLRLLVPCMCLTRMRLQLTIRSPKSSKTGPMRILKSPRMPQVPTMMLQLTLRVLQERKVLKMEISYRMVKKLKQRQS